jgi:hypothetical protein
MKQSCFSVIARSPCDEAIHLAEYAALDCFAEPVIGPRMARTRWLCAEHDRQLGGESLLSSLIVVKD